MPVSIALNKQCMICFAALNDGKVLTPQEVGSNSNRDSSRVVGTHHLGWDHVMPGHLPSPRAVMTGKDLIIVAVWDRADDNTLVDPLLGKLL